MNINKYELKEKLETTRKQLCNTLNPYSEATHYLWLATIHTRHIDRYAEEYHLPPSLEKAKKEMDEKINSIDKTLQSIEDEFKKEIVDKKYTREFLIRFHCNVSYKTPTFKDNCDWDYQENMYNYYYKYNTLVKNKEALEKIVARYTTLPEVKQRFYEMNKENYKDSPYHIPEKAIITRVDLYARVFRIDDLYSLEYWKEATPLEELPNLTIEF